VVPGTAIAGEPAESGMRCVSVFEIQYKLAAFPQRRQTCQLHPWSSRARRGVSEHDPAAAALSQSPKIATSCRRLTIPTHSRIRLATHIGAGVYPAWRPQRASPASTGALAAIPRSTDHLPSKSPGRPSSKRGAICSSSPWTGLRLCMISIVTTSQEAGRDFGLP
jgi:hypothetical protein